MTLARGAVLARVAALAIACCAAVPTSADQPAPGTVDDARIASAWRLLRSVECARCHGRDYEGLVAPSIVRYAATEDRDAFVRAVLDGDPQRGMPPYRGNAYVASNIDDIYRYFVARANGDIGADYRPPPRSERE